MALWFPGALAASCLALLMPGYARAAADPTTLPTGDAAEVRTRLEAWNGAATAARRGEPLLAPVGTIRLSSPFGVRTDPFNGGARRHAGVDLPGTVGTPVHAAADGVVAYAGRAGSYGNLVEIAHGDGLETRYAHMARVAVAAGALVRRGDVVGLMGSTGRSTGSHLHFEVRVDGRPADPVAQLDGVGRVAPRPSLVAEHWAGYTGRDLDRLPAAQIR